MIEQAMTARRPVILGSHLSAERDKLTNLLYTLSGRRLSRAGRVREWKPYFVLVFFPRLSYHFKDLTGRLGSLGNFRTSNSDTNGI
jgi:hypothetical protein